MVYVLPELLLCHALWSHVHTGTMATGQVSITYIVNGARHSVYCMDWNDSGCALGNVLS